MQPVSIFLVLRTGNIVLDSMLASLSMLCHIG